VTKVAQENGAPARIGPNAVIRTVQELEGILGRVDTERLLRRFGLEHLLDVKPDGMRPEEEFLQLVRAVTESLPPETARAVLLSAGRSTGSYVLENRIPGVFRKLAPVLPRSVRLRLLLSAFQRHAWTFAGSGRFEVEPGSPARMRLELAPEARNLPSRIPLIAYYTGSFEVLLRGVVASEVALEGPPERDGGPPDRFEMTIHPEGLPQPCFFRDRAPRRNGANHGAH